MEWKSFRIGTQHILLHVKSSQLIQVSEALWDQTEQKPTLEGQKALEELNQRETLIRQDLGA